MKKLPIAFDVTQSGWNKILPIRFIFYNKSKTLYTYIVMMHQSRAPVSYPGYYPVSELFEEVKKDGLILIYE